MSALRSAVSPEELASGLLARIRSYGAPAVAFSGGVDSAVVAQAAFLVYGELAVAVTAVSPSLAASERDFAAAQARAIGIRHVEIATSEFTREEYRRNAGDRCYFCKDTLYSLTRSQLAEFGVKVLLNGANLDDAGDHRPGMQAAVDHGVRSPLLEERLNKTAVRALATLWNLQSADKPAAPCLASRIAYGVEVTEERVGRIEQAEAWIRKTTGIRVLRVRCEQSELARIEVQPEDFAALMVPDVRDRLVSELKSIGFRAVTLDLEGFRSGNLNGLLVPLGLGEASHNVASEAEAAGVSDG
ncbi:MAG: ATP-dependent sacrificial sulfur transferase LarE [Planctomycetota bacterium]